MTNNYTVVPDENHAVRVILNDGGVLEGWTASGLNEYLKELNITYEEFSEVAGVNTGFLLEEGDKVGYMLFKQDVERFIAVITENKPTYFD